MRTNPVAAFVIVTALTSFGASSGVSAQEGPLLIVIEEPTVAGSASAYVGDPGPQELTPASRIATGSRGRARRDWALIGAGAGMGIGGWALSVVGSLFWVGWPGNWGLDNRDYLAWSAVPIVGPFMQLGTQTSQEWQGPVAVIVAGVQLAGWIMAIVGTASGAEEAPDVAVVPVASEEFVGITAGGRF